MADQEVAIVAAQAQAAVLAWLFEKEVPLDQYPHATVPTSTRGMYVCVLSHVHLHGDIVAASCSVDVDC